MSEEMTDEDVRAAEDRERKAHVEMQRITGVGEWWGRRESPRISIPADEERDSDLVIGRSLSDVRKLAAECLRRGAEIARLRAEVETWRNRYESACLDRDVAEAKVAGDWPNALVEAQRDRAESAEARVAELEEALAAFLDNERCHLDHHGYCQTHGHLSEGPCHMAVARAILAPREPKPCGTCGGSGRVVAMRVAIVCDENGDPGGKWVGDSEPCPECRGGEETK